MVFSQQFKKEIFCDFLVFDQRSKLNLANKIKKYPFWNFCCFRGKNFFPKDISNRKMGEEGTKFHSHNLEKEEQ